MSGKATSPGQKLESAPKKSPYEGGAKNKTITAKDISIPTKRKVAFQSPPNSTSEKDGTFNLPEDRGSYLPLTVGADVRNSVAAAAASRSATLFSSTLQKPSSNEVSQDPGVTDANFERRHKSLKDAAWHWANENFSSEPQNGALGNANGAAAAAAATAAAATAAAPKASPSKISDVLQLCLDHPELAEFVNFLASCPHNETWEDFFNTRKKFLAFAVLAKVLEVHIFGQEMFGASEAQVKVLRALDLEMVHQDGFARQVARATIINSLLSAHDKALPLNFYPALTDLQARITALVSPLQQLPDPPSPFHESLSYILLTAACLSLDMRRKPSTIYYLRSVTRESPLDSSTTHVLNSDRFAHDQIYHDEFHEPIVRIAAWPIVEAYRPGQKPSSASSSEDDDDDDDGNSEDSAVFNENYKVKTDNNNKNNNHNQTTKKKSGITVRRICKGEAYVEWGVLPPALQRAHYRDQVPTTTATGPSAPPSPTTTSTPTSPSKSTSTSKSPTHLQPTARLSLRQDVAARLSSSSSSSAALSSSSPLRRFFFPYTISFPSRNYYEYVLLISVLFLAVAVFSAVFSTNTTQTQTQGPRGIRGGLQWWSGFVQWIYRFLFGGGEVGVGVGDDEEVFGY